MALCHNVSKKPNNPNNPKDKTIALHKDKVPHSRAASMCSANHQHTISNEAVLCVRWPVAASACGHQLVRQKATTRAAHVPRAILLDAILA
jgi:hypothetical protein